MSWNRIGRLEVEGVRNIRSAVLDLEGKNALLVGGNGAGKTSLLESVYVLARGRSFRRRGNGDFTSRGMERTKVGAVLVDQGGDVLSGLSYLRARSMIARRRNGIDVEDLGGWMRGFPVRLIGEGATGLLEGEPSVRRGFLDLNLFHVEPGGESSLKWFRRALGQRNAWLRDGARGREVWDQEFVSAGLDLHVARTRLLDRAQPEFQNLCDGFDFLAGASLEYRKGWREGDRLEDALASDKESERSVGFTRVGPHRADLIVRGAVSGSGWSYGEAKIIVCLVQLAFERVQWHQSGRGSVWLVDDVWADLEPRSSGRLCALLQDEGVQCLFTRVGDLGPSDLRDLASDTSMFHVKQGAVSRIA